MTDDRQFEVDFVQRNYDHNLKTANYLIAAHGACLLLALSALKDYTPSGPLKGIGLFILLFGLGLLAAMLNYASLSVSRSVAINAARDGVDSDEATTALLSKVHLSALATSLGTLVVALTVSIWRYAGL